VEEYHFSIFEYGKEELKISYMIKIINESDNDYLIHLAQAVKLLAALDAHIFRFGSLPLEIFVGFADGAVKGLSWIFVFR
jgi:hypothetical protein